MRMRGGALAIGLAAAAGGFWLGVAAAEAPAVALLVSGSKTIIGQPLQYPAGTPKVTAAVVTLQPGDSTGWHRHDVPVLGYMVEGELTVDYGPDGTRTYRKGEAFLEAFRTDHDGKNSGDGPASVLAVYMGAEGAANTVPRGE